MTRSRLAFLAIVLAAGATSPAAAQGSPVNALQEWGLLGTWAVRCDQPPSMSNSYNRFVVAPDGRAYFERDFGDPSRNDRSEIAGAELRGDGTLALTINFTSFKQVRLNAYAKSEGRVRVMYNRGPAGDVTVENGVLKHNGQATPWSQKCDR
jgi:hypothetical protein